MDAKIQKKCKQIFYLKVQIKKKKKTWKLYLFYI